MRPAAVCGALVAFGAWIVSAPGCSRVTCQDDRTCPGAAPTLGDDAGLEAATATADDATSATTDDGSSADDGSPADAAEAAALDDGPPSDGASANDAAKGPACDDDQDTYAAHGSTCGGNDCDDLDPHANPGVTGYQTYPPHAPTNGDWNCDGVVEKQYAVNVSCGLLALGQCAGIAGFTGSPACGASGPFVQCQANGLLCSAGTPTMKVQGCK